MANFIVDCNNHALDQLVKNNNILFARDLLETAVECVSASDDIPKSSVSTQNQLEDDSELSNYRFNWTSAANYTETKSQTFIFSRGLQITPNFDDDKVPVDYDCKAAIFYNAGILFHLIGHLTNDSSYLTRAMDLYISSQSILRNALGQGKRSVLCFQHCLHVALLNNLGQISYELIDYDATEYYFQNLKLNLKYFVARETKEGAIDGTDYMGMVSNTMIDIPIMAPSA